MKRILVIENDTEQRKLFKDALKEFLNVKIIAISGGGLWPDSRKYIGTHASLMIAEALFD